MKKINEDAGNYKRAEIAFRDAENVCIVIIIIIRINDLPSLPPTPFKRYMLLFIFAFYLYYD